jgi:membrane protease subunit HflK
MTKPVALFLAFLAYLATGLLVVESGEKAVIFRLGAVDRAQGPGLGIRAPWPLEWDERVDVEGVRRVEPGQRRLLTGDTNLVELALAVQFTVLDPVVWLTGTEDPEGLVAAEVAGAAAEVVSSMQVDSLLTGGRTLLQRRIKEAAQSLLDGLGAGVYLASIEVRNLVPPSAVVDAFNDVSSAQGDQQTLALAAEAYASELGPRSRGAKVALLEEARAASTERLARTEAEISRFLALQKEARQSPEATRISLRNDLLRSIGSRVKVLAVGEGSEIRLPGSL